MAKPRVLFYDIETTNLNSNYGYMLSAGWKWKGEKKVYCVDVTQSPTFKKDPTNDKFVVQKMAEAIAASDVIIGHYSSRFDRPYINTRLLYHGLEVLPPVPEIDTWRISKYKLKLNSNRLATIAEFFECGDKTPVLGNQWIKAMAGDPKAIKYVVDHNKKDVLVLENVYEKIKVLCPTHPNIALVEGKSEDACPVCAEEGTLQKRGYNIARTCKSQRLFCTGCGSWSSKPMKGGRAR